MNPANKVRHNSEVLMKSQKDTPFLSKYFNSEKEVILFLKKNAPKYSSFRDAEKRNKKMKAIRNLYAGNLITVSVYEFFGGRKRSQVWSKEDWFSYLDKTWKKYSSLSSFIANDPKGRTLKSQIYKGGKVMYKTEIYKRYWNKSSSKECREIKAMNKFAKELSSLSCIDSIKKEVYLNSKSRVDLVVNLTNGRVILIEGKHDDSAWIKSHTSEQVARYARLGKKNYGNRYHKTILCSPKGKYGLSFKEVVKVLKSVANV